MKNIPAYRALWLSLLLLGAVACQKDPSPAPLADEVTERLMQEIAAKGVNRVVASNDPLVYNSLIFQSTSGKRYDFRSPFIIIDGQAWNLTLLKRYEVINVSNGDTALGLLF